MSKITTHRVEELEKKIPPLPDPEDAKRKHLMDEAWDRGDVAEFCKLWLATHSPTPQMLADLQKIYGVQK